AQPDTSGVEVTDSNRANAGSYELQLTRFVAACDEASLPCDTPAAGIIAQHFDRDLFALAAQGGEGGRVDLAETGADTAFDPRWRLLDATTGEQVRSTNDNHACGSYGSYGQSWTQACSTTHRACRVEVRCVK